MPSLNAGPLAECLRGKLRAVETSAGNHRVFVVLNDAGYRVARTKLSHSWRDSTAITAGMVSKISRELGLRNGSELQRLVQCSLSRDDYLGIATP